jgi:hypothetical protein
MTPPARIRLIPNPLFKCQAPARCLALLRAERPAHDDELGNQRIGGGRNAFDSPFAGRKPALSYQEPDTCEAPGSFDVTGKTPGFGFPQPGLFG